ncbi:MAG: site-specific integrase [Rectinemataceae bacterium]|nr:site-specific integrase [Rectinemataceae bacterium]
MAVSPFFIVVRTLPCGTKRFVARFLNPDCTIMRSTTLQDPKIRTKNQAVREADRLLKEGVVPKAEDPYLYDFLMDFWRPDSDYVKAKTNYEPRAKAAIYLGVLCGMRLGEVRGLQWSDIDFGEGIINLYHNIPSKTKKLVQPKWDSSRTIPLPKILADVLQIIQTLPDASPSFVIFNRRNKLKPATEVYLRKVLGKMLVDIGMTKEMQVNKNIVFHSLRHTYISISRANGEADFAVQSFAGHKNASTTGIYSHPEVIDFKKAKRFIDRIVDKAQKAG